MLMVWKPLLEVSDSGGMLYLPRIPVQCTVKLLAAGRDSNASLADFLKFSSSDEAGCTWLLDIRIRLGVY